MKCILAFLLFVPGAAWAQMGLAPGGSVANVSGATGASGATGNTGATGVSYPVTFTTLFTQTSTPTASEFHQVLTSGTISGGGTSTTNLLGGIIFDEGNQAGNGVLILDRGNAAGGGAWPASRAHLRVYSKNTNNNQPLVESEDTSTNGGSANVKIIGPDPDVEYIGNGTNCYAPHCRFETTMGNNSDDWSIQGRNGNNSAFEKIALFHIWSSTIDTLTQFNTVGNFNELTFSSVAVIRAMSSNASTSWTGVAFSTFSVDSKNHLLYLPSSATASGGQWTNSGYPLVDSDADHHLAFNSFISLTSTFTQIVADPSAQSYMMIITSNAASGNSIGRYMVAVATTGAVMLNTTLQPAMLNIDYFGASNNTGHGIALLRSGTQVGYLDTNSNTDIVLKGNTSKGARIMVGSSINGVIVNATGEVSLGGGAAALAPCSTCTVVAMGPLWQKSLYSCTTGTQTDATGQFSACVASDARLKEDFKPFDGIGVENLNPYYYRWKNKKIRDGQRHVGFKAQDIGKVLPEAVTKSIGQSGEELGIDDKAVMAILVNEIKALKIRVKSLEAKGAK